MKYQRVRIIALLLIALLSILCALYSGSLNNWRIFRTHADDFLNPLSTIQSIAVNTGFVLVPLLFLFWMIWVSGGNKIFKRAALYVGLFASFMLADLVVVSLSSMLFFDVLEWGGTNLHRDLTSWLVFLILLPVWNYFLAMVQSVKLDKRQLVTLFLTAWLIPLYCFAWGKFLSLFIEGEFASDSSFNGGFTLALILYEGVYFLWLNSERSTLTKR